MKYADFLLHLELPFEALTILRNGFRIAPQDFEFRYMWALALQKCWFLNLAEKEFDKFSEKEKREMKKIRKDPQELKLAAIQTMLSLSARAELTRENSEEIKRELELAGLNPQIVEYQPPKTKKQRVVKEYMEFHFKVEDVERKISGEEFQELKGKLLNPKTEEDIKKSLLILAHQGTKETIELLEEYLKKAQGELLDWTKLALEECKMFSKAKPGQIVKIFH